MPSSIQETLGCRKNAVGIVKKLYRAKKITVINTRPPGGKIDVSPTWRTISLYIDPVLTKQDVNDHLVLGIILRYRKRRLIRGLAEAVSILSLALIGGFSKSVTGLYYTLLYLGVLIASALIAMYIIVLSRKSTSNIVIQDSLASIVLSDPICYATASSIKELLSWVIEERDREVRSNEFAKGKLRWPRRMVLYNRYRDIVKGYPALLVAIGPTGFH
ncbi:MAG: hypothetical protein F7B59_06040 [Desulfurococcales archaeon]|nr:hypothetical protein [Desulfurococcales archaeon]